MLFSIYLVRKLYDWESNHFLSIGKVAIGLTDTGIMSCH